MNIIIHFLVMSINNEMIMVIVYDTVVRSCYRVIYDIMYVHVMYILTISCALL